MDRFKIPVLLPCVCLAVAGIGACGGQSTKTPTSAGTGPQRGRTVAPLEEDNDRDYDGTGKTRYDTDDYKILAYGREASVAEKQAVVMLVKRYYALAAAGDGRKACALMSAPLTKAIVGIYGRERDPSAPRRETCPAVASHLFKRNDRQLRMDRATLVVTDVRLGDPLGYALLKFRGEPDRHLLLYREAGAWKVDAALQDTLV